MAIWGIIVIVCLVIILTGLMIFNIKTVKNNQGLSKNQIMIPFAANYDPTQPQGAPGSFVNSGNNEPQIQCPTGTRVNIIAAFYDIFDPYGECSPTPDPLLGFICNPAIQSPNACTDDSGCPGYIKGAQNPFICAKPDPSSASGFCQLRNMGQGFICPGNLKLAPIKDGRGNLGYYCVNPDVCGTNIDVVKNSNASGVPNPICNANNTTRCAIRDASATVADFCNGRQDCKDLRPENFGDRPCTGLSPQQCIDPSSTGDNVQWVNGATRTGYCALPFLKGYQGGVPDRSTGSANAANFNMGYTMHGIYTCVPDA